jgi:hypothetical protein
VLYNRTAFGQRTLGTWQSHAWLELNLDNCTSHKEDEFSHAALPLTVLLRHRQAESFVAYIPRHQSILS